MVKYKALYFVARNISLRISCQRMIVDSPIQCVFDKLGSITPDPGIPRLAKNIQKTNECPVKIDGWKMKSHYLFRWHDTFQGISSEFFKDPLLTIDSGLQYRHWESMLCFESIPKQRLIGIPVTKKNLVVTIASCGPVYLQRSDV